jgi:hypothetical protein
MKNHVVALAEAVRLARRELETVGNSSNPSSADQAIRRLSELLESEDVNHALAALNPVDDAPSIQADPPVNLRVPYPWRSH